MHLVKDLIDSRIVYYWVDDDGETKSPLLSTFTLAEHWWKEKMFARHQGLERRRSVIDRRSNNEKRRRMHENHPFASINPQGRRSTDKPPEVTFDLAASKLRRLAAG
ncbi:hypothetical protein [Marinobacterium sediminicola]|uniref:Uncharacterized protein n=1 Tax=Marinobacterium sediminicola TaxID=518898 RepID=A0ABY1S429_9GAMM|nr:hypothetical protein [Marinobacterium sediminicola]ULG70113.1 hypothetical protein LN244_04695 [Marinobacterium sediminicola]SMR78388.1 hypothetical protein SAMN04487964_1228 [Marinobacterium sediminicola]